MLGGKGNRIGHGDSRVFHHGDKTLGAARRIDDDGKLAAAGGIVEHCAHPIFHDLVAFCHAFRCPWRTAAQRVNSFRDFYRYPGALQQPQESFSDTNAAFLRTEHGINTGWNVHRLDLRGAIADDAAELGTAHPAGGKLRLILRHSLCAHQSSANIADGLCETSRQPVGATECNRCPSVDCRPTSSCAFPDLLLDLLGIFAA